MPSEPCRNAEADQRSTHGFIFGLAAPWAHAFQDFGRGGGVEPSLRLRGWPLISASDRRVVGDECVVAHEAHPAIAASRGLVLRLSRGIGSNRRKRDDAN